MILGLLNLLEAASTIYSMNRCRNALIALQIIIFFRDEKLQGNYFTLDGVSRQRHIGDVLVLIFGSLLISWIANPLLTCSAIIFTMFHIYKEHIPNNLITALLVLPILCILGQLDPRVTLFSLYSIIGHADLISSLYMNMKERVIISDEKYLNSNIVCYYIATCLVPLSMDMNHTAKIYNVLTHLLTAYIRIKHAYDSKDDPSMWSEKFKNSCHWMTSKSLELCLQNTRGFAANPKLTPLYAACIAYTSEPDQFKVRSAAGLQNRGR